VHIQYYENIKNAWETFYDVHEAKTIGNKLFLRKRFFTIKMQEGEDLLVHINMVKAFADQLRSIEVKIEDEDVYMVLFMSLPPSFDNLVTSLESVSTKDVDLQFIVDRLLHEVSKRRETESTKNVALLSKTHKANEKLCFYYKKLEHFVRNCLKKKSDEKEKVNQAYEYQEQMFVATLSANDHTMYDWIIDFGATQHMTFEREWFTTYESIVPWKVYMGDDTILEAIGKRNIKATMQVGGKVLFTTIIQVFHVPKMKNSFISISKLISEGLKMEFDKDGYKANNVHGIVVAEARKEKNLYLFNINVRKESTNVAKFSNEGTTLWHQILDHLNMANHLELEKMVNGMNLKEVPLHLVCETCIEGKHQKTYFPKDETTRVSKLLELVHSDVCKLMKTTSRGGTQYFVTFIDDFSRKTHVYLLKVKGEMFDKFKAYKALVENQTGMKIKTLRSNNGGEFVSKKLMTSCMNVESNNKQVHLTHHNKMELWNELIGPSWSALEA